MNSLMPFYSLASPIEKHFFGTLRLPLAPNPVASAVSVITDVRSLFNFPLTVSGCPTPLGFHHLPAGIHNPSAGDGRPSIPPAQCAGNPGHRRPQLRAGS